MHDRRPYAPQPTRNSVFMLGVFVGSVIGFCLGYLLAWAGAAGAPHGV